MNEYTEHNADANKNVNILDKDLQQHIDLALSRAVKPEEVEYVLAQMPHLQMINLEFNEDELSEPRLITAKTGWIIQDYQEAICSSPGHQLWKSSFADGAEDDDGESGGTVVYKSFNTAVAMVQLAQELGWIGISIVDGDAIMKWAAWVEAENLGLAVHGFEPTAEEKRKRKLLDRSESEIRNLRHSMRR